MLIKKAQALSDERPMYGQESKGTYLRLLSQQRNVDPNIIKIQADLVICERQGPKENDFY